MKIRTYFLAMMLILCSLSITAPVMARDAATTAKEARVMQMKQRVEEIRKMDFSEMSHTQRKEVKTELKEMKAELKSDPTYIYISGGALLLIIIILILIL